MATTRGYRKDAGLQEISRRCGIGEGQRHEVRNGRLQTVEDRDSRIRRRRTTGGRLVLEDPRRHLQAERGTLDAATVARSCFLCARVAAGRPSRPPTRRGRLVCYVD